MVSHPGDVNNGRGGGSYGSFAKRTIQLPPGKRACLAKDSHAKRMFSPGVAQEKDSSS